MIHECDKTCYRAASFEANHFSCESQVGPMSESDGGFATFDVDGETVSKAVDSLNMKAFSLF